MKKIKKQMNKGVFELNDENAFDLFISTADIKFCYYNETQRILGTTFGMLILQDFEAITPNLLCRTIETVQGGGVIIFLYLAFLFVFLIFLLLLFHLLLYF